MKQKLTEADIKSLVALDESALPYPDDYYLYRERLDTAPSWYRLTYGDAGLENFKKWHVQLRRSETLSRFKRFRFGVQITEFMVLYDDQEWALIDSAWKSRREWKG